MPPDFLFFFILWLIFFRKPDIFFNVNGRRRPRRPRGQVRLGGVTEVQLDLRSDMANSCLVDGRQKLHRCVTYHTEIGHAADYVGRQARDRATRRP